MKILATSMILASLASAGMHGYNNCYLASTTGLDNLNSSPIGLHIDSTWDTEYQEITNRNTFENGYLLSNGFIEGQTFTRTADTLSAGTGNKNYSYVMNQDRILRMIGPGTYSEIRYSGDTILRQDLIRGVLNLTTKEIFSGDSMRQLAQVPSKPGQWLEFASCEASPTGCNCDDGLKEVKIKNGSIEIWDDDTLTTVHYTSIGNEVSIRSRPLKTRPTINARWRANGTSTPMPRSWMPLFGQTKKP